ncbi:FG-GAP-like repeat-containing protein [Streptomyces sp. NPDC001982]|uniref:FG-GAP-like repeat-containing protein n=1 Tax=Streptomyces sp. NPDC001982 TaxID=3154405 RepID=UPI00331DDFBA
MARHAYIRLRLLAASAVLSAGLAPLLPSSATAAVADVPQETVVPATLRSTYTSATLQTPSSYNGHDGAGTQGVFHTLEGTTGFVWTRYSDGKSVPVTPPAGAVRSGTGSDAIAYLYSGGRVDLWNAVDGTTRTIQMPPGLSRLTEYGDLAVGYRSVPDENGTAWREMHLLIPETDGTTRDVPVTGLPEGVNLGSALGGDTDRLLFQATRDGQYLSVMVDRRTGQMLSWTPPRAKVYLKARVTTDHVVLFNLNDATVLVFPRSDLSATPVEVTLGGSGSVNPAQDLAVVGDWLIHRPSAGTAVRAKPLSGGPEVTLLTSSDPGTSAVSNGTAVVVGRTGADDWGIQRIVPGPDGSPVVTQLKALPRPPFPIQGLSLDQGRLVTADYETSYGTNGLRNSHLRTVSATGVPTFGDSSPLLGTNASIGNCPPDDQGCASLHGTADGRVVWVYHYSATTDRITAGPPYWELMVPAGGRITDLSGRYLIYTTATQQFVYRIGDNGAPPVVTRPPGAAALSGDVLWTAGTTPGTVTAYDLTTKKTAETLTTDAGCTPAELQALGRWLYWRCDGRSGVYDRTTNKSVPVPADEAELGDGYVVTHDKQAGKLVLTTIADGTPAGRVIGDLPDTGVSQRDVRWTVDESGANAAYVDGQERVHLVPSGVPQQPLRLQEPARNATWVDPEMSDPRLYPLTTLLLSKPAAGWRLTVRDKATGKVVDTRDGGLTRGELKVGWSGTTAAGLLLPNGQYDWTLSVTPADGAGAPVEVQGTFQLKNATPVRHDYEGLGDWPDGIGDLLTLSSTGTLGLHRGTGKGTFSGPVGAGGWATSLKAVPVGDLSGDRCNDVLVRYSSGALRLYKPGCNEGLTPTTPYTTLYPSGWDQYDVITSPGDVSGDGRPDVLVRKSSTGAVYLYKATSTGKLAARVQLYDNWKTYKKVVGAGDLNGDGIGDLVAQDKLNQLYRYYGTGKGTFSPRVKISPYWGVSYNVVVGAGDITGDGKSDLVMRDTAGNLYRQNGLGNGTFATRVKIGTGWQGYKGLF